MTAFDIVINQGLVYNGSPNPPRTRSQAITCGKVAGPDIAIIDPAQLDQPLDAYHEAPIP